MTATKVITAQLAAGAATSIGRRQVNADTWSATARRVVVADGAGVHGRWAAHTAVAAVMHAPCDDLMGAILDAHRAVRAIDAAATTVVVVELATSTTPTLPPALPPTPALPPANGIDPTAMMTATTQPGPGGPPPPGGLRVIVAHVGDSGCLFVPFDGPARWLTEPHNVAAQLVSEGVISAQEATTHPYRNRLTRCLGSDNAQADMTTVPVRVGDRLLLCSDGISTTVHQHDLDALVRIGTNHDAAAALVAAATAAGGGDNMTAVVVDVCDGLTGPCQPDRPVLR